MRDGECGDFARTLRHRTVMTALYKRVIDKSTLELVAMIPKILPMLTTNIKKEDLVNYIAMAVQVRDQNKKIYTLNVPAVSYNKAFQSFQNTPNVLSLLQLHLMPHPWLLNHQN